MASPERIGVTVSAAGHVGFVLWVLLGGMLFRQQPSDPVSFSEVSMISEQEFAALEAAAAAAASETPTTAPEPPAAPSAPEVSEPPAPRPVEEKRPDPKPQPEPEPQPEPDPAPDVADLTPPTPEVPDLPPSPLAQPVEEPSTAVLATVSPKPKPRPAPRVAPTPSEAPAPDAQVSEQAVAETKAEPTPEAPPKPEPPKEEAAPPEATTQIVTEATETDDKPESSAPLTSSRPKPRPKKPEAPAADAKPAETKTASAATPKPAEDPLKAALDEAMSGGAGNAGAETARQGQGRAASGPPLTSGEKEGLRVAVSACWNTGSLSTDALRVTVTLAVSMSPDGRPDAGSIQMIGYEGGTDAAARQAYEAARRAIIRCGANGYDLPAEKYEQWAEIEMVFNPEKMRIK